MFVADRLGLRSAYSAHILHPKNEGHHFLSACEEVPDVWDIASLRFHEFNPRLRNQRVVRVVREEPDVTSFYLNEDRLTFERADGYTFFNASLERLFRMPVYSLLAGRLSLRGPEVNLQWGSVVPLQITTELCDLLMVKNFRRTIAGVIDKLPSTTRPYARILTEAFIGTATMTNLLNEPDDRKPRYLAVKYDAAFHCSAGEFAYSDVSGF